MASKDWPGENYVSTFQTAHTNALVGCLSVALEPVEETGDAQIEELKEIESSDPFEVLSGPSLCDSDAMSVHSKSIPPRNREGGGGGRGIVDIPPSHENFDTEWEDNLEGKTNDGGGGTANMQRLLQNLQNANGRTQPAISESQDAVKALNQVVHVEVADLTATAASLQAMV